ncbi:MAG: winged helix-turn-helix domain-containing protein [Nitrososphaerales archaeon]
MGTKKGKIPKWIKEETRKTIFKELEKESLTFEELLKRTKVSRATLATHLKEMIKNLEVRKIYSEKKDKIVYELTSKAFLIYATEARIRYLGSVALYSALKEKLGVSSPVSLKEKIEEVLKAYEKEGIAPKEIIKYMEKHYPFSLYKNEA